MSNSLKYGPEWSWSTNHLHEKFWKQLLMTPLAEMNNKPNKNKNCSNTCCVSKILVIIVELNIVDIFPALFISSVWFNFHPANASFDSRVWTNRPCLLFCCLKYQIWLSSLWFTHEVRAEWDLNVVLNSTGRCTRRC